MKIHFVKAGETLSGIAAKHGVTAGDLLAANPAVTDPDVLQAGMKLIIPDRKEGGGQPPEPPDAHGHAHHGMAGVPPAAGSGAGSGQPDHPKPEEGTAKGKDADKWPGKWPDIPKLPPLPAFPGAAKASPCKTCQQPGGASAPYAPFGASWSVQPGGLKHPFAAVPVPAEPAIGHAGHQQAPVPLAGGPGSGSPWPGGSVGPTGGSAGPWFVPGGAGWPWPGSASGGWGWPGGAGFAPWSGGTAPGSLAPATPPWVPPADGAGFHSPYNTPFSVDPYAAKPDAHIRPADGPDARDAGSPPFVPPHAQPAPGLSPESAKLHQADEPDGEEPDGAAGPRGASGRKPAAGKKRKRSAEPTLKDKVLRMQRGHRRR